jgi:hypothetical protein
MLLAHQTEGLSAFLAQVKARFLRRKPGWPPPQQQALKGRYVNSINIFHHISDNDWNILYSL